MSGFFGGIEAGGTKWICAAGQGPEEVYAQARIPTTTPEETLGRAIDFFQEQVKQYGQLRALGVGSFGPLDPHPNSPAFGFITSTPKPGWADTDVVGPLRAALGVPVAFDTDVNAAALGEARRGAARGLEHFIYLTVGTGIGGGALVNGKLLHGLLHPEMGHIRIPHNLNADPFPGSCPFHGDCLEGLAAGPALQARWGQRGETLPEDHPAWSLEAHYLALAMVNFICILSPQRIILGGGIMAQTQLFPLIRQETLRLLNEYIQSRAIIDEIEMYIVPPGLGGLAGILGALALAQQAFE